MLPPSPLGSCRLLAAIIPSEIGWMEAPEPCNSPHSASNRNLFKSSQGHIPPKLLSAYFSPCKKNGLARVKSDNSLEHQTSITNQTNNQKLIQDNLSVGIGSCKKSHILLSMAVELCIKVSTSWLLSSWPLAHLHLQQISSACDLLLSQVGRFLTCQLQESLSTSARERNTGYEAVDSV